MKPIRFSLGALIVGLVTLCWNASGSAGEPDALRLIPVSCNAVAVVQMRNLVNTPLGKRRKWFDEARRAYAEGLLSGPPWVKEIVHATAVGSATGAPPLTYSIYTMNQSSIIEDIAKHELARPEKLAGHGAVASPRNVYFVQLGTGLVAAIQPADRNAASQWVQLYDEQKLPTISPDLVEALKTQDSAAGIDCRRSQGQAQPEIHSELAGRHAEAAGGRRP